MTGLVLSFDARFASYLIEELRERGILDFTELWPGVAHVTADREAHANLKAEPPLFLRHMFPVHHFEHGVADHTGLSARVAGELLRSPGAGRRTAVQCRVAPGVDIVARDIKSAVDGVLRERGFAPAVKGAELIISVICLRDTLLMGLSAPADNLTDWSGGAVHYSRAGLLSRAGHKLEEAVEVFGIELRGMRKALDLGAAPGGFTRFLLDQGLGVTAVDTADLDPSLKGASGLLFLRENAFTLDFRPNTFDIITCDMSWDPVRTAQLILRLAPALVSDGQVVLSVKFMAKDPLRGVAQVKEKLSERYRVLHARQLWHNREEATLHLIKEGD